MGKQYGLLDTSSSYSEWSREIDTESSDGAGWSAGPGRPASELAGKLPGEKSWRRTFAGGRSRQKREPSRRDQKPPEEEESFEAAEEASRKEDERSGAKLPDTTESC